jgi:hypothetical protein
MPQVAWTALVRAVLRNQCPYHLISANLACQVNPEETRSAPLWLDIRPSGYSLFVIDTHNLCSD